MISSILFLEDKKPKINPPERMNWAHFLRFSIQIHIERKGHIHRSISIDLPFDLDQSISRGSIAFDLDRSIKDPWPLISIDLLRIHGLRSWSIYWRSMAFDLDRSTQDPWPSISINLQRIHGLWSLMDPPRIHPSEDPWPHLPASWMLSEPFQELHRKCLTVIWRRALQNVFL